MANWCDTHIVFFSKNSEELQKLNNLILQTALAKHQYSDGRAHNWMGSIFENYMDTKGYSLRGFITEITPVSYDMANEEFVFDCYQDDAWSYHTLIWRDFLRDEFPDIDFVFKAEEPGCDLFVNSDIEGKYFAESYVADIYLPEREDYIYFNTKKEFIDYFSALFHKDDFTCVEEIQHYINTVVDEDNDEFCYIHKFEYAEDN